MGDYYGDGLIDLIHPKLRPYVKTLVSHEFGLLGDLAKIENVESGSIVANNDPELGDRFVMKFPYCRKFLYWQILMNPNDLNIPPDFIMDDNFLAEANTELIQSKVPSLANWCPTNIKCLLNVVLELLDLYKQYQVDILRLNQNFYRFSFEYETLVSMINVAPSDVEICILNTNRGIAVIFQIRLNVDFSNLPAIIPDNKNLTVLVIEFKDNARNVIQLFPRQELEDALGGSIEMPDLPPDMSLIDYVPLVQDRLQKQVRGITEGVAQRKLLYSYLVQYFEPALLNGDTIKFQHLSFLLEMKGFYCVLKIEIPIEFPKDRPRLTLFSLRKVKNGMPRSEDFLQYNYNPKMQEYEMAKHIYNYVKNAAIIRFKENLIMG